jgi:vitamin B12 transporter
LRSILVFARTLPFACLPLAAAAQPVTLSTIVLSANRVATDLARTGSSVSVLTAPELEADGRPFVLEQLRDLPGVTVQQNGPPGTVSGFAIRGAPAQYVRVQVDGIEVSDMTAPQVTPSLSGLLADDVGRVEVLRGSQSALYGGQAIGGVVSITSPRPSEPGIGQRFVLEGGTFSTFRGAYTLTGLDERGEFALTAARFRTDGFSAAEEADGNRERDGYETTRLSASGRLNLTGRSGLFGAAFWQREDGDYDETVDGRPVDAPSTFDADAWGVRAGLDFETDFGLANTLAVSYYDVDRTNDAENPLFGPSTYRTQGDRTRVEYLGAYEVSEALAVRFGADYAYETTDTLFRSPFGATPADGDTWIAGAFVQSTWSPDERLTIDAAARADEHSEFGFYPTGRLTVAFLPEPETTIRGSLGTGFRAPSNFELFDAFSGDPSLDPETSLSADLGITRRFGDGRGEASATAFWLQIDDLIEFDDATFTYVQDDGTSRSRGVELSALWAFNDAVAVSGAYTYTDAEQPDGAPRDRIPRHDLALAVLGEIGPRLSYDLNANLVWDFVDDSATDFAGEVIASDGFARDFVVVNARVAYALTDDAEVYVRAANLLDERYQTARGYSTADRAFFAGVSARF